MESFSKHPRKNTEEKEEQADWNNVTTNLNLKKKDSNNDNDDDNVNNNDDDDDDDKKINNNNNYNNWIDFYLILTPGQRNWNWARLLYCIMVLH